MPENSLPEVRSVVTHGIGENHLKQYNLYCQSRNTTILAFVDWLATQPTDEEARAEIKAAFRQMRHIAKLMGVTR